MTCVSAVMFAQRQLHSCWVAALEPSPVRASLAARCSKECAREAAVCLVNGLDSVRALEIVVLWWLGCALNGLLGAPLPRRADAAHRRGLSHESPSALFAARVSIVLCWGMRCLRTDVRV
jgi:hypothetical protein